MSIFYVIFILVNALPALGRCLIYNNTWDTTGGNNKPSMPLFSLFRNRNRRGLPLHPCWFISAHICGSVHLNLLFPGNATADSAMGSPVQTDQWLASHFRHTHSYTHTHTHSMLHLSLSIDQRLSVRLAS